MKTLFVILTSMCVLSLSAQSHMRTNEMKVSFTSDAPLELIQAEMDQGVGIISTSTNEFAFKVGVSEFHGFNSALQQEHFNENYMETGHFALATFTGRLIEDIDFGANQTVVAHAAGILTIHGVAQDRVIDIELNINKKGIRFTSNFDILLEDHNIDIPRLVENKIASTIYVSVEGILH